ncbi:MAG TPA: haloacid dehalogenase-like hydrolase [Firmicutes bacterium]|nr:haloacid dehalogenase-like hydrolase [Bacillota bacterium]
MVAEIFLQSVIAVIWDFDKTLIPGYMQEPLFRHFAVDSKTFWREVELLPEYLRREGNEMVAGDSIYLNHILAYVRAGLFSGLNNQLLRKLGGELEFYPGLPEFFPALKEHVSQNPLFRKYDIKVEHYIVSTGLRQMILGSKIAPYTDGIWGCEFIELLLPPGYLAADKKPPAEEPVTIRDIGYVIDNTTKTRAIFEINKGSNKNPDIDVNSYIPQGDRRIPFQNMIYIADGPSDVPVFSLINQNGGRTFGVYAKGAKEEFAQVNALQKQGRVHAFGEANYEANTQTQMWIMNAVEEIGHTIVRNRDWVLEKKLGSPPRHLAEQGEIG